MKKDVVRKKRFVLSSLIFLILLSITIYAQQDLLSLQGRVTQSGSLLSNGNITMEIWDSETDGNLIFNSTEEFNNSISAGFFDVLIGSVSSLNLNASSVYYLDLYINGEDVNFSDDKGRLRFQSPVGIEYATNFTVDLRDATFFVDSDNNYVGIGTLTPSALLDVNGLSNFRANASFLDNLTVSNVLYVDTSAGRVGIGTTSPTHTLNVLGDLNVTGNIYLESSQVGKDLLIGDHNISSTDVNFSNANNIGFFYDSVNNRIGIGTFTPGALLDVSGLSSFRGNASFLDNLTVSNVLFVDSSGGRVGIGTASPDSPLTTTGNVNLSGIVTVDSTNIIARINTTSPDTTPGLFDIEGLSNFQDNVTFSDNLTVGSDVLYADTNLGRVGIGVTSPSHKLNVLGDVNITGQLWLAGAAVGSGANVTGGGTTNQIAKFISATELVDSSLADDGTTITSSANIIPSNNAKDLGSASNLWRNLYVDIITATSIGGGSLNASGTNLTSFIIDSDNPTNDTEDINLIYELGSPTTNAVLKWDSTNKYFDFNKDLNLQQNLSVAGNVSIAGNLTVGSNALFVDSSLGMVGIGTSAPSMPLDVIGNGSFSDSLNVTNTLAVGPSSLLVDNSGNVGIGITSPNNQLDVAYNISAGGLNIANIFFVDNSTGNVGINTTTPANTLNVLGDLNVTGQSFLNNLNISGVTFADGKIEVVSDDEVNSSITDAITIIHTTTDLSNGTAGIGPSILFKSEDSLGNVENVSQIQGTLTTATDASEAGALTFLTRTAGGALTEQMMINGSGSVGIATTSPSDTLNVGGTLNISSGNGIGLYLDSSNNVGIGVISPAHQLDVAYNISAGGLNIANIFFVDNSTGNVGINTTTPTSAFHVYGAVNLSTDNKIGFFYDSENNSVGIREASPSEALNVTGSLGVTGTIGAATIAGTFVGDGSSITAVPRQSPWSQGANTIYNDTASITVGIGTSTPQGMLALHNETGAISVPYLNITTVNVPLFIIDGGGNIGIRTTVPSEALNVTGNLGVTGTIAANAFVGDGSGLTGITVPGGSPWAQGVGTIYNDTAGITVGIGIASPAHQLDVAYNISATGLFISDILLVDNSTGNVGIGTTSPAQKLEVAGSVNLTNNNFIHLGESNQTFNGTCMILRGPTSTLELC